MPRPRGGALAPSDVDALGDGLPVVFSGFLGPRLGRDCAAAVRALYDEGQLRPAALGRARHHRPEVRGDHIAWLSDLDPAEPLVAMQRSFEILRETVANQARIHLPHFDLQIACYPGDGAQYQAHVDTARGDPVRRVTAICYLNPTWRPEDGGVLRCLVPSGDVWVEPRLDHLVLFRSDQLVHEVQPARALRLAVTAWFSGARPVHTSLRTPT